MRIATTLCICLTAFFSSCTMAPRLANHEYSTQIKMESVAHWESLARKVVEYQVLPSLPVNPELARVYVDASDQTDFGRAFHTFLITEMMNCGVIVSDTPDNANTVKWSTQLVQNTKAPWYPGVVMGTFETIGFIVAGSSFMNIPSDFEVIITTQVNREYMVLTRMTHNYYLDSSAKWNFWSSKNGNTFARR